MTPELDSQILGELRQIKWVLLAMLAWGVLFLYGLGRLFAHAKVGLETARINAEQQKFRAQTEGLLQRGSYEMAAADCERRLKSHPNDFWAHYFLGQAFLNMSKLHEARRAFERAGEIAPDWERNTNAWLERTDKKLKEAGPKLVN